MGREYAIIHALQDTDVPVPPVVGFEPDTQITGAPFYVMDYVDGVIARDEESGRTLLDLAARKRATTSLVDVLARLHAVEPDEVGLGNLGRKEDYIARQLKRWHGQFTQAKIRELPLIDQIHERLMADIPEQGPAAIVHGDYRLDNLILSKEGTVRAVLDWELCTLGDPLADVGLLMVYWSEPSDRTVPLASAPTLVKGFPTRKAVAQQYAAFTGRDLSQLDFYVAFGLWKLAIILEGVYARFAAGAYGDTDDSYKRFGRIVKELAEQADRVASAAGR
jgi:aminoglycoside phosphotransferase (APT) family kinase protein